MSKLIKEKEETERRVSKLEKEVAALKSSVNNEGREIAAFEEETLALRRELQEALATRNLADGTKHGTKCVNAVSRSVTPVIFETPRITSTPVRTALTETCNLVPAISSSIPSTSVVSDLRSRSSELALFLVRDNKEEEEEGNLRKFGLTESIDEGKGDDKMAAVGAETQLSAVFSVLAEETAIDGVEHLESVKENRRNERIDEAERTKAGGGGGGGRGGGGGGGGGIGVGTGVNVSQRKSSSRRSRRKRAAAMRMTDDNKGAGGGGGGGGSNQITRKTVAEECSLRRKDFEKQFATSSSPIVYDSKRETETKSEEEEEPRRSPRDRLVEIIPEVTVVDGGSFVPKDLCSGAGILTSRVLTAPSRATYTTAYI
ncbi:hypothetical protein HZH68_008514 [Vespula germanica]|uniref:Uncharacterized protein n=1 Tax=Vespula germanica TaxID=30212 RepID=A0A834N5S0_VESGE|nr:hypothetical protein HZH68_008514 [Vespula germanica]